MHGRSTPAMVLDLFKAVATPESKYILLGGAGSDLGMLEA